MTFCVAIKVREGVVALSDTRIVRGSEIAIKGKLAVVEAGEHDAVVMTSGLRSVRDKVVRRLEDDFAERAPRRMHEMATAFGHELRSVEIEDGPALASAGLGFNLHAILAGRLDHDDEPALFHLYPEGNWVEATVDAPYVVIGRTHYGKPILDRLLRHDMELVEAVVLAYLAFDATQTSVADVDFPIDIAVMDASSMSFRVERLSEGRLAPVHDLWKRTLGDAVSTLASQADWAASLVPTSRPQNAQEPNR